MKSEESSRITDNMSDEFLSEWIESGKPISEFKKSQSGKEKGIDIKETEDAIIESNTDDDARVKANLEKLNALAEQEGFSVDEVGQNFKETIGQVKRGVPTGFEDTYIPDVQENNQSWAADFGEALYEGLVINAAKGVTNLIPTMFQMNLFNTYGLPGVDKKITDDVTKLTMDWTSDWINTTTAWFDGISPTYSDAYYRGDFDRKLATGLGQGLGFIGGIMLGGAGAVGAIGKGSNIAARLGSFATGTTMMYPMVYEEAIENNIDPAHASRLALGISGLVSLTEGAALEAIGKTMSKPLVNKATKEVLKKELTKLGKATSLKDIYKLEQNFAKGFSQKIKAVGPKMFQGSAIEAGQEFSQTYIEEGMKQLYDGTIGRDKKKGEGAFGAEIRPWKEKGYETFEEAVFGGLVGGILGGALPSTGMFKGKVQQETLFNYVNKNVRKGKHKNIYKIEQSIRELQNTGKLNEEQANQASAEIKKLVKYSNETKALNITDDIANYQLYQLSDYNKQIKSNIDKNFKEADNLPKAINQAYRVNRDMGDKLVTAINQDMDDIITDKKPYTKSKNKFEKRLQEYRKLAGKVYNNEITEEDFNAELESIKTGKTAKPSQQKAEKDKAKAVEYKTKDGDTITESAMQDAESILKGYNAALDISPEAEAEFQAKLKEEYGIEKEGLRFLVENEGSTVDEMKANLEATEIADKKEEPKVKKVKAYRTEGTEMGKLDTAFRGSGKYYALDKPFVTGKEGEVVTESEIEIDESKTLDLTKSQETGKEDSASKKYSEIRKEAKKRFDAIPRKERKTNTFNDLVQEVALEQGIEGVVSYIEPGAPDVDVMKEYGREYVDYRKPTDKTKEEELSVKEQTIESLKNDLKGEFVSEEAKKEIQEKIDKLEAEVKVEDELDEDGVEEQIQEDEQVEEQTEEELKNDLANIEDAEIVEDLEKPTQQSSEVKSQKDIDDAIDSAFDFLNDNESDPKEQRATTNVIAKDTVRNNPALQKKIVKHFRKIFPNIPVKQVERIASEYGGQVLGRVVEKGIEIDSSQAFQNTIIHEYAHVYMKILGKNDPVIKLGLELIEDTKYFEDAKKAYPNLSKADQLEEALAEAIADNSYEKLKIKFEGSNVDKFVAFLKKFWSRIKRQFTKSKSKDIVDIISDGITFREQPFMYNSKILTGVNKEQRATKKAVEATSMIQGYLSMLRMKKVEDKNFIFDPNNSAQVSGFVYTAFKNRYNLEKENKLKDNQVKIFDDVTIDLIPEETKADVAANRNAVMSSMENDMPQLYEVVQRSIESLTKSALPTLEEISSDSAVKANKKISESIRSIVTAIIDYDGRIIDANNIDRYVADLAANTYGKAGFEAQLQKDAEKGKSIEASRFYEMLGQMSPSIKQSIVSELSSLIQTKYTGLTLQDENGVPKLTSKIVNEDESVKSQLDSFYQRIELLNDDFGLDDFIDVPKNRYLLKNKDVDALNEAKNIIEQLYDIQIDNETWGSLSDDIIKSSKEDWGMSNFLRAVNDVIKGDKRPKAINTWSKKVFKAVSDKTALTNNFPNMSGNSVSSTNFGYFISEQASMMFNKEGHLDKMKKNPIYKNNPVFKMIVNNFEKNEVKDIDWAVHDALSNMYTSKVMDHPRQYKADTVIVGLSYFANDASKNSYRQSIGVSGDRSKITTVRSPRFDNFEAIKEQLIKDAATQQKIFNNAVKGLDVNSDEYKKIVENFNDMYMNKVVDGKVVTPNSKLYPSEATKQNKANIAYIKQVVRGNKLEAAISKDHVGAKEKYKSFDELVGAYYYTEAINRNALMDLFAGTMLDRKNVADAVKRGSGYNSGGTLIEHNKPVTFVVYDVPSEVEEGEYTSDSMSIDGTHLHKHTMDDAGVMGNVGTNKKDFIFQVDPSTSKTFMVKMSSIGIEQNEDGTNFDKMGPEYKRMGDAFLKAEKYFANKYGDNAPHIKFVDSKTLKGNDGSFKKVKLTDLLNDLENNEFGSLEDASFEMEVNNHRVAFDLNKDLSKIPLEQQEVVLSTQERVIASTKATKAEIDTFEQSIVDMLQESLGMSNEDYYKSKTKRDVNNPQKFLDSLLKNADEQKSNSISELLYNIRDYNQANPSNPITVYDDPNLVNLVQQAIATKFTKDGIRTEMAGNYLHMLPNYGNDLKWYDYGKTGTESHPEIGAPMSMFVQKKEGETDAEYVTRANKYLEDAKAKGGLRTVVVRVPASKGMSTFVATVKYFTDPSVNTVIVPDGFIKASDADHDGDKTFVYREDIKADGTINVNSTKNKAFNELHKRISSEALVEETKDSLKLEPIKDILEEYNLDQTKDYKLTDAVELANITEQMGFGERAIGILANASKMLSVMSQSKEGLKFELRFGYEMEMDNGTLRGKLLDYAESTQYQDFVDTQGSDMARLLQAALDMGNDPILMSTGINAETINVATTLTLLGVPTKQVIGFLNNPAIKDFNIALTKINGGFGIGESTTAYRLQEEYLQTISPDKSRFKDAESLRKHIDNNNGEIRNLKEGVYQTKKGDVYFSVTNVGEQGIGTIEMIGADRLTGEYSDLAIIEKYLEIKSYADALQKLLPIIKLDTNLPNNGVGIKNLSDVESDIKQDEYPITVDNLLNRPLNKHQMQVAELQKSSAKSKFITQNDFFFGLTKKFNRPKASIDNSFMHQHAEKSLRLEHSDPKKFIYDFANDISNIIYSGLSGEINVPDARWQDSQIRQEVEMYSKLKNENRQEYNNDMANLPEMYSNAIEELIPQYEEALNNFDRNLELSKNKFINALQVSYKQDEDGSKSEYLIKSKTGYSKESPTVKQEIKDAFLKLPQDMQDKFVDYQLLRHGVNEKMGSLMGMLPNSLGLKTDALSSINEITKMGSREDYFKNQKNLIERNTALSMLNTLSEPKYVEKIEEGNDNLLGLNSRDAYIKQGENIYKRTSDKVDIKGNELPIYKKITNDQFVAGKHFTKFGTEESLEESKISDEQIEEEIKKCRIKPKK